MADHHDAVQKLHTRLIDAHDGMKTALEKADASELGDKLRSMSEQRGSFAARVRDQLSEEDAAVDRDGSILGAVHRVVQSVRDAVDSGDEAITAEVVRGEEALLEAYDDAIEATSGQASWGFLEGQRSEIASSVASLKAQSSAA